MTGPGPATCVVVGGGPGGMILAYLLGRAGVATTVLEAHQDFDRDFRGDSLHPYTLELLDRLGLAERLLKLPHEKARYFRFHTPAGAVTTADYGKLASPFPYVVLMPQARFLAFLAEEIGRLPGCRVRTGCRAGDLDRDAGGRVRGVRYRAAGDGPEQHRTLAADLVVGADGRHSRMRRQADITARPLGATTDLLWFRLPRHPTDPPDADLELYFGRDHYVGVLTGTSGWQVGYTLPKGGYKAVRDAGVAPIRTFVAAHVPWLADRVDRLTDLNQTALLSVEIARADRWWVPGLLLIGDAAHVISPIGGNGILMAVQDAVAAANRLIPALRDVRTERRASAVDAALAAIQAEREPAVSEVQDQQVRAEQKVARARDTGRPIAPPRLLKLVTALPGTRRRAASANAYGPLPPRLTTDLLDRGGPPEPRR